MQADTDKDKNKVADMKTSDATPVLIIGNKNYSTWSLRAWLLLAGFGIKFIEQPIELFHESAAAILSKHSPTGKVPVLVHQGRDVWDSMAIALYVNEWLMNEPHEPVHAYGLDEFGRVAVKGDIWGDEASSRAFCQSMVGEMHSGFMALRNEMPMNIRATARIAPSPQCLADLARIEQLFEQCHELRAALGKKGSYLFGRFSAADAFYAPVALRLRTYAKASGIELKRVTEDYIEIIVNDECVQRWITAALQETRMIDEDEAGEIVALNGVLKK